MKQLFEYTDNVLLMKDFIFSCLNDRICNLEKSGSDLESLRCVCKKLKEIIVEKEEMPCKIWKNKCMVHCKAYPFYKHLDNKYTKHRRGGNGNLHFNRRKRYMANMFQTHFRDKISSNGQDKLETCCDGLGFKIIS